MIKKLFCLFLIICFLFISTGCTKVESVKSINSESEGSQFVLVNTLYDKMGYFCIYRDVKTGVEYIKSGSTSLVVRINADGTPYIEEENNG